MWHLPWLPNGTVHPQEEAWRHLHHESEENLGGTSVSSLCHFCQWKSSWWPCHILQDAAAAGATLFSGCFTPGTFHYPDSDSLPGAKTSGSYWFQGCPPASHRNLPVSLPTYYCVTPTFLGTPWTLLSHATTRERPQWGWCGWMLAWEVLHMCGTMSHEHPREVMPEILKTLKGKSRQQLIRQWLMRNFRVNAPLQLWGVLKLR